MNGTSATPLSDDARALLRHAVAALSFRFEHAVAGLPADPTSDAPAGVADFDAGQGVRTPLGLVLHMTRVVGLGLELLGLELLGLGDAADRPTSRAPAGSPSDSPSWPQALDGFRSSLRMLDDRLADERTTATSDDLERLLHGPICDVASHVGQLLLLRRLAGHPAAKVSYLRADVTPGRLGP